MEKSALSISQINNEEGNFDIELLDAESATVQDTEEKPKPKYTLIEQVTDFLLLIQEGVDAIIRRDNLRCVEEIIEATLHDYEMSDKTRSHSEDYLVWRA